MGAEIKPGLEKRRVLVVEDDPSWQQILGEILTDLGLEVDLTSSYAQAVELMRQRPHRLAILDLSLGGPDHHNQEGILVAEALRRRDPSCVIMFLTGFATVELAVRVMRELNALTCLRKETFRRSEFRQVVNEALSEAPVIGDGEMPEAAAVLSPDAPARGEKAAAVSEPGLVLVIEDDAGWRSLLSEILGDAGYQVRTSSSYVEAISLFKREKVQVAVIDLSLASSLAQENLDGYRLLAVAHKAHVPVIVVSGYAEPARIEQAFRDQLIYACVEKQAFDRKAFQQLIYQARSTGGHDPVLESLTDREREVLVLLARGLTNKEIARELVITPNTVKRHMKSLFAKMDVSTRAAASAKAIGMGLGPDSG